MIDLAINKYSTSRTVNREAQACVLDAQEKNQ